MSNRTEEVVSAVVDAVRGAVRDKHVNFDEYRAGIGYLMKVAEAGELPLLIDLFLNIAICDNENRRHGGSLTDLEGPYYRPDAPFVDDEIKTMPEFNGEPMMLHGTVRDTGGAPIAGAVLDIWQSTPDGKYSGFHDNIPVEYYRGKVKTDAEGRYEVRSTVPVPYQIPHQGPVGALLEMMGRHSWRPAHVHYKVQKEGFYPLTTQAYFEGGDYVGDDCCEGISNRGQNIVPKKVVDGIRVMDVDFTLDRA